MLLGWEPPMATGCSSVNSVKGRGIFLITCQTPLVSRSDRVTALRSASSRKREAMELVPLRSGQAPTMRELLVAPLIWSLTVKDQVLLVLFFWSESALRTTARRKF